jgi:glucose-1-phosphate thymidylyltransferase
MKAVLLAGGNGTRLRPLTRVVSKQLLPIYDKPIIYYSLSTLFAAGVNDICIITNEENVSLYRRLLGDGSHLGVKLSYLAQERPEGLPQGISLASDFIGDSKFLFMLGDNFFYGEALGNTIQSLYNKTEGAGIFLYQVANPEQFGVATIEGDQISELTEKPINSLSKLAVTGLYCFEKCAVEKALKLHKSDRNEYEIIDLLKSYIQDETLSYEILGRGYSWMDTGTFDGILDTSNFVRALQKRQGLQVGCLEELSYRNGWIDATQVHKLASTYNNHFSEYLRGLTVSH